MPTSSTPSHLVRWIGVVALVALVGAACSAPPSDGHPPELVAAIAEALPDLEHYELVTLDDAPLVASLEALIEAGTGAALQLELPTMNAAREVQPATWIAYHVDVRDLDPVAMEPDSEVVAAPSVDLTGPSRTFRGIPDLDDDTFGILLAEFQEAGAVDTSRVQPSVLNLIGDRLEGARMGGPDDETASVLDALELVLEFRYGAAEAQRLAALTPHNYLVYRQQDFQPEVHHGEHEHPVIDAATRALARDAGVTPLLHTTARTLRPVMIADDTIYDPSTDTWLIEHWFERVDAAANRQGFYLLVANLADDVPAWASWLPEENNRVVLRTKIAAYLVLTPKGKDEINPKPVGTCDTSGTFINRVTALSNYYLSHANEYWMWWTNHYGGGCAWIQTLGWPPANGAVGWVGFGDGTIDWVSYIFMHEGGHILGGTHVTDDPSSPETAAFHRCRLFGIWPFGPSGPSLMSYADGVRTYCFAATPSAGTPKRNLTRVAEFLHGALQFF